MPLSQQSIFRPEALAFKRDRLLGEASLRESFRLWAFSMTAPPLLIACMIGASCVAPAQRFATFGTIQAISSGVGGLAVTISAIQARDYVQPNLDVAHFTLVDSNKRDRPCSFIVKPTLVSFQILVIVVSADSPGNKNAFCRAALKVGSTVRIETVKAGRRMWTYVA